MSTSDSGSPRSRRRGLRVMFDPGSPALTIAGIFLVAAGFLLIAVGWFDVSGVVNVALQMPYVVSAALAGLGLIVIGTAVVAIAAKREDSDRRIRKLERLEVLLRELGSAAPSADGRRADRHRPVSVADPAFRASMIFAGLAIAGLVALVLAWIGVSGTLNVGTQVAYTASGGIGGLALVICGAGLLFSHLGRWAAAREDDALDDVLETTSELPIVRNDGPAVARKRRAGARK